jgi:type I restriction enzyme S subunit
MEKILEIEKVKKGYKKTPVGLIPKEWEVKKLGSLGEILSGLTYSPSDIDVNGTLVLRSSNVKDRQIELLDNVYVRIEDEKFNPVQEGDILICVRNGSRSLIGKNAIITKEVSGSSFGAFMAIYRSDINSYLYQIFDTDIYQKEIHKNIGATINSINGSDFKKFSVPIPTENERLKIVSILSTWDEAIAATKNLITQTKKRNQGLAQLLITGKKRLKGFDGKWERLKISDFSNDISLKNKEDKDLIVLSCTKHHGLVPSLEYFGRKIYSENLDTYKIVARNCFAYATNHIEEGSIGYQDKYDSALISPMYTVFKTNEKINDSFLYKVLKSHAYIHEYQKRMEGSIDRRGGLRWDEFSKIKVSVPSLEEQKAINEILEIANQELKTLEQKLKSLVAEKKGLMQKLLTGEIRVKI